MQEDLAIKDVIQIVEHVKHLQIDAPIAIKDFILVIKVLHLFVFQLIEMLL